MPKEIIEQCTEVSFASFRSGGFTTMAVINPPEKKLAKRTSVWKAFRSFLQPCVKAYNSRMISGKTCCNDPDALVSAIAAENGLVALLLSSKSTPFYWAQNLLEL